MKSLEKIKHTKTTKQTQQTNKHTIKNKFAKKLKEL